MSLDLLYTARLGLINNLSPFNVIFILFILFNFSRILYLFLKICSLFLFKFWFLQFLYLSGEAVIIQKQNLHICTKSVTFSYKFGTCSVHEDGFYLKRFFPFEIICLHHHSHHIICNHIFFYNTHTWLKMLCGIKTHRFCVWNFATRFFSLAFIFKTQIWLFTLDFGYSLFLFLFYFI